MKKVMLYALSTCPWCMKTKKFLKDNHIKFEFVDYDMVDEPEQEKIMADMEKHGGGTGFPYVIIDDEEIVVGYNPEKLTKILGIKK
jgi:glutaredoxin